ncbi:hypothetical protein SRB5_38180 [Streptomyces sp. RB5]|uniref:Uncharacterized protein n=1 Tax=Streptomyces smaragdinus TaxID=2585196 RepID=A0A7K0CJM8_9ACTN|nr:hypothetical protein [Streptomyces smaragdinus]MQY13668.1 hypothetical protein [Streptomyces smaragdinus]
MIGGAWLGDLVRAAHALGAGTPEELAQIAGLLGLGGEQPASAELPNTEDLRGDPAGNREGLDPGPEMPPPTRTPRAEDRVEQPGSVVVPLLEPVEHTPPRRIRWTHESLERPRGRGEPAVVPPHLSLLAPRSTAALLTVLLSRIVRDGELDVERATEELSQARPLDEIPRLPVPTLRYGVQILADVSASMEPFARDVRDVIREVRALAGAAGTEVLWFSDAPGRGAGPGSRATWRQPCRLPRPGARVLILSDLGMGGPPLNPWRAGRQEWQAAVGAIRQRGCEPVALVPLPEQYWPRWARMLLPMVVWDRGTIVSKALGARP